jgi:hypothetical protein
MNKTLQSQIADFFTEQERLEQIDSAKQNRATITNINYNKQHKQQKITLLTDKKELTSSSSFGFQKKGGLSAKAMLPFEFKSLKVDLFDNQPDVYSDKRKFKVAVNIINSMGRALQYRAKPNSESRFYKRNVVDKTSEHYRITWELYESLKGQTDDLRVTKFYTTQPQPGGNYGAMKSMQDMSLIMHQTNAGYYFYLILQDQIVEIDMTAGKNLTPAQKKANIIGSACIKQGTSRYQPAYAANDWGSSC